MSTGQWQTCCMVLAVDLKAKAYGAHPTGHQDELLVPLSSRKHPAVFSVHFSIAR